MPLRCPACSKSNPADAFYCYADGRPLSKEHQQEALQVGSMPFPSKLFFADGQVCGNFNQLVLGCNDRWEEARELLAEGVWATFFRGIGRLDLAAAARQAAAEADLDRGLSQLLEQLPADPDSLRLPRLAVESAEEDLGELMPGADLCFEVVIRNEGLLLLRGTVALNGDWLVLGDGAGSPQKLFQARKACAIAVRALGSKLRAGLKPLQGEILIDTNGGTITVPVRARVPIRAFPKGSYANDVLAGAMSPREIALRAKQYPLEAAQLFEQGAVKDWYVQNGWTYPIEGSVGSGKGAVQQFFEALGLTAPPRLKIDTASLTLRGKVGQRLSQRVAVHSEEAKPVYAQAWSNQDWVKLGPIKYLGNKVKIPIEIVIPPRPGETLLAQVTVQGNGKQQFVVPVSITVDPESLPAAPRQGLAADSPPRPVVAPEEPESVEDDKEADTKPWTQWIDKWWKRE